MANCCMAVWWFGDLVDLVVRVSVRRSVFVSLFSHATIRPEKTSFWFYCGRSFWPPAPTLLPTTLLTLDVILLCWFR